MRNTLRFIALLVLAAVLGFCQTSVTVTGPVLTSGGQPYTGDITVTAGSVVCGGSPVISKPKTLHVVSGTLKAKLLALGDCGQYYTATYQGNPTPHYWTIPSTPTTTTVGAIEALTVPSLAFVTGPAVQSAMAGLYQTPLTWQGSSVPTALESVVTPAAIGAVPTAAINQPNGVVGIDANGNVSVGATVLNTDRITAGAFVGSLIPVGPRGYGASKASLIAAYDFNQGPVSTILYNTAYTGARANLLPSSTYFNSWSKLNATTIAIAAVPGPSPSGAMADTATSATAPYLNRSGVSATATKPLSFGVWAHVASGTLGFKLDVYDTTDHVSPLYTATTTWQHFCWTYTPTVSPALVSIQAQAAGSIDLYGAHANVGTSCGAFEETPYPDGGLQGTPTWGTSGLLLNGTNQYATLYDSQVVRRAVNPLEGSVIIAASVADSTVWGDVVSRTLFSITTDVNNKISVLTDAGQPGRVTFNYTAGGVSKNIYWDDAFYSGTVVYALTWSKLNDTVAAYINGNLIGSVSGLGTWVGALSGISPTLGYSSGSYWKGTISYASLYTSALSSADVWRASSVVQNARTIQQIATYNGVLGFSGDSIVGCLNGGLPSYAYHVANITLSPYVCAGVSGDTTTQILARFQTDLMSKNPTVCVLEGGHNDQAQSVPYATVAANLTTMVQTCKAANLPVFYILITPSTIKTNTSMQTLDTWNASLSTLMAGLGVTTIDLRPLLGKFRAGGDAGNLWDLQSAFDDGGGIHLTSAGAYTAGQEIARVLIQSFGL